MPTYIDRKSGFWHRVNLNHRLKYERLANSSEFTVLDVEDDGFRRTPLGDEVVFVSDFACSQHSAYPPRLPRCEDMLRQTPRFCLVLGDLNEHTFRGGLVGLAEHLDSYYGHLVSTYECPALSRLRGLCRRLSSFYVLPHHIDMSLFRDYGLPKTVDIFLYGSTDRRWYPFRRRLAELLPSTPFTVRVLPHPGYDVYKPQSCGESLARMINESWLTIATPSTQSYFLYKYLEIAAARSVVAGVVPAPARPFWKNNYVRLSPRLSDKCLVHQLKQALSDKDELTAFAENASLAVRRNFGLDRFVERLAQIAEHVRCGRLPAGSVLWKHCGQS